MYKNKIYNILFLTVIVLFFYTQQAVAANFNISIDTAQETQTDVYNERVTVVAPYQPSLNMVYKPDMLPTFITDSVGEKQALDYKIISAPILTKYPVESIKAAKVSAEPIDKLFNQYIKLGFGTHLSPLAEGQFAIGRSEEYGLALSYKHFSSYGKIKDYSSYTTTNSLHDANLLGEIYKDKFNTSLNVNYRQDLVNCYGVNDNFPGINTADPNFSTIESEQLRWYQNFGGKLTFTDNAVSPEDLRFDASFDFNLNMSNWHSMENTYIVDGGLSKDLLLISPKVDRLALGFRVKFEDNTYRSTNNAQTYNAWNLKLAPTLEYEYSKIDLYFALQFNVYAEEEEKTKLQFNPSFDLKFHAIENVLTTYFGFSGDLERKNLNRISEINPYLTPLTFSQLRYERDKFFLYLGLNGKITDDISYNFRASTHWRDNVLNFTYHTYIIGVAQSGYNDFKPLYTEDVFNFRLKGELSFRWSEAILSHVEATYNYYNKTLYYTPAFEAKVNFRYNIAKKFIITTEILAYTNMKALDRVGKEVVVKGGFDWSLGFEYRFLPRWSAFANVNNLIAQRFFKWYDYPTYRTNFVAGLTFSF